MKRERAVWAQINMDDRQKRMSCPSRSFVEEMCQLRQKKDGESGTKTQNRQGFVWCWGYWSGYDAKTAKNSFRGIQSRIDEWRDYDSERNYFPFVRLEKMFFPAEGPLEDRGNIFHGRLYCCIKRKLWSGRKEDPEVGAELNVEPLKWYTLKSCGNK